MRKSRTIWLMAAAERTPSTPPAAAPSCGSEIVVVPSDSPAQLRLSQLRFTPAASRFRASGLLGWLSFVLHGVLRVDGVAVRRTRDGRLSLSFPERVAHDGKRHPIVRPLDDRSRAAVENAVIAALEIELRESS
jgi:hypothetical protein